MKILPLIEDKLKFHQKRLLLQFQQDLIDALPEEWDVGLTKSYDITLGHPDMPGNVWFGPMEYLDIAEEVAANRKDIDDGYSSETAGLKHEIEGMVIANYDVGRSPHVTPIKAVCVNDETCESSVLLRDLTAAFQAILIYHGFIGLQDASEEIDTIVKHLLNDVRATGPLKPA